MTEGVEVQVDIPPEPESEGTVSESTAIAAGEAIAEAENAAEDAADAEAEAEVATETADAAIAEVVRLDTTVAVLAENVQVHSAMIINLAETIKGQNEKLDQLLAQTAHVDDEMPDIQPDIPPESSHWLNKKIGGGR